MSVLRSLPIEAILKRGSITEADVAGLRRAYNEHGALTGEEADTLLIVNDVCVLQDSAWTDIFVEILSDYVVNQMQPEGYLTQANSIWLVSRISTDGRVGGRSELELLLAVVEKARWVPLSLVRFGLEQVKHAVAEGRGPLRFGEKLPAGTITDKDVQVVRRLLMAFGAGNLAITAPEADALFDINDASSAGTPNPGWAALFVSAIANAAMAASGHAVPSRKEALSCTDLKSLDALKIGYREQSIEERALAQLEQQRIEIITNELIAAAEPEALAERIDRNGGTTPNKYTLLLHLAQLGTRLDAALQTMLTRFHRAA